MQLVVSSSRSYDGTHVAIAKSGRTGSAALAPRLAVLGAERCQGDISGSLGEAPYLGVSGQPDDARDLAEYHVI